MSKQIPHESAIKHVTGESVYVDDILVDDRLLHGLVVYSPHARARIRAFDLSAAKAVTGVHAVLSYKDIPGENQMPGDQRRDLPGGKRNLICRTGRFSHCGRK